MDDHVSSSALLSVFHIRRTRPRFFVALRKGAHCEPILGSWQHAPVAHAPRFDPGQRSAPVPRASRWLVREGGAPYVAHVYEVRHTRASHPGPARHR